MFTWYWLADLCDAEGLTFVLGHALTMKAVHGGRPFGRLRATWNTRAGHGFGRRDRPGGIMIANDQELHAMLERIRHFQEQVAHLRIAEASPTNFRLSVSGFLAEIDRMQLEVREYLSLHPADPTVAR